MGEFDKSIKWMASQEPAGLLKWLAGRLKLPEPITLVDPKVPTEIVSSARYADVVWLVEEEGERFLLHLEVQYKPEEAPGKEIGERVAGYGWRLYERDHLPVESVVLFLRRTRKVPRSPFVIRLRGKEKLRYDYQVIRLWEQPQATILTMPYPVLWPLAGLMAGVTQKSFLGVAEQIVETVQDRQEKSLLVGILGLLAGVQLSAQAITHALRSNPMIDEFWQESSVAQALVEEGRLEGIRQMAQVAIEARYGPLDADLLQAIHAADEPLLKELVAHPNESLEQVRKLLGQA